MDFLEMMNHLFAVQKEFPTMVWDTTEDGHLIMTVYVGNTNVADLDSAKRLFEPAD